MFTYYGCAHHSPSTFQPQSGWSSCISSIVLYEHNMDVKRKGALTKHHQGLRTGLLVENILPTLRPLLTDIEYSRVGDGESNIVKVDKLIEILLTKENRHFEEFCAALESNGYGHWAKTLREEIDDVEGKPACVTLMMGYVHTYLCCEPP